MPCIRRSSIQKNTPIRWLDYELESFAEFTTPDTSQNGNLASLKSNVKRSEKSVALYPFHGSHLRGIRSPYLQPLLFWRAITEMATMATNYQ